MATAVPNPSRAQVPPLGAERPVVWPRRFRQTLDNGLEVALVESRSIPKFTADLFFRSGNAVATVPGLAQMTATVARTGTMHRTSHQIEDTLRGWGADLSISAGADTTSVAFAGLVEFARPLLDLVSEIVREASFPAEEFERERRQKIEGLRIDRTTPDFLAAERVRKVLFGMHPYANYSPTEQQVEGYTRDALIAYYRENYAPAKALLVAAGDFSADEMWKEIEGAFGGWKGAIPERGAPPSPPELRGRRVYFVHLPGAVQTQIVVANMAITRKHPDWMRLSLANNLFGGAFNSRLVRNIREEKGYTYSPRSSVHALKQHGFFSVGAAVRNDVVAATLTEIFYELDRIRALPVGEEELADTRNYMSGVFSLGLGTQDGIAGQLGGVLLDGLPEEYLEKYRERIRALQPSDVLEAARRYFDSANAQIIVVGDRDVVATQAALFGELEMYDAAGNRI
jgi:predicted Zn-dependent peptidase